MCMYIRTSPTCNAEAMGQYHNAADTKTPALSLVQFDRYNSAGKALRLLACTA